MGNPTDSPLRSAPARRAPRRPAALALAAVLGLAALTTGCSSDKKASSSSSSGSSSAPSEIDTLLNDGVAAQSSGQLDVATQKYKKVTELDPTNKIAFFDLGVVYQSLKDDANARSSYERALAIDATYSPALFNLAILETPTNPTRAEQLYRSILVGNATDVNTLFNLGLLLKSQDKPEGDDLVQQAIQLDPSIASRLPASDASTESSKSSSK